MKTKFYRCNTCGNIVVKIIDSNISPHCCGKEMTELVPKTEDFGQEKHVPVVTRVDDCTLRVDVGSIAHPMSPDHSIQWIYLETKHGGQFVTLPHDGKPCVAFCTCKEDPISVYEFCNVHGLWKKDLGNCEGKKSCCVKK